MQVTQVRIDIIDNGYLVVVSPQAGVAGAPTPGAVITQYCPDKNTVATYLMGLLVPGATYTPPAAAGAPT